MLAVLAVVAAVAVDLVVLRSWLILSSTFWTSYAILLFFQLIMNGILTGLSVVRYDPHTIIGLRLAYAPVEDVAFGFALITLTLSCWVRLSTGPSSSSRREPGMTSWHSPPSPLRRAGLGVAVLAALSYSAFLLGHWTSPHAGRQVFVSELEAAGQPYNWLFRVADVVSGLAILVLSWIVYATLRGPRRAPMACGLLAVLGLGSIIDGSSTMSCLPTPNTACARAEHSANSLIGQLADLHTDSGLAGFVGAAAGALLLGVVLQSHGRPLGRLSIALGLAVAGAGLLDLLVLLAGGNIAVIERTRILLTSVWLLIVGLTTRTVTIQPQEETAAVVR